MLIHTQTTMSVDPAAHSTVLEEHAAPFVIKLSTQCVTQAGINSPIDKRLQHRPTQVLNTYVIVCLDWTIFHPIQHTQTH